MRHRSLMVFFMAMTLVAMAALHAHAAAPRISVKVDVLDFGAIVSGETVTVKFTVVNEGDAELVIKDLKTSCGCTAVVTSAKNIAPGGSAEVEAVFDSAGHTGKVSKTVTIVSNDPQQPQKDLTITGTVTDRAGGELIVTPHSLNTGNMAPGASKLYTYELRNGGVADLAIAQIETTEGVSVQITVPFVIKAGETREVKFVLRPGETVPMNVTIAPKIPEGKFQEMVTIYSTSVQRPAQRMVIRGTVKK